MDTLNVDIDASLKHQLRVRAVDLKKTLSQVVTEAVVDWLASPRAESKGSHGEGGPK